MSTPPLHRSTCPKCGYCRQPHDQAPETECPACGIVFAKYAQHLADKAAGRAPQRLRATDTEQEELFWQQWLFPPHKLEQELVWLGTALLGLLAIWGASFALGDWRTGDAMQSFLHGPNLAFHEFGHILFRPFGDWIMFLGGSLFQCLLPLLLAIAFLWKRQDALGAAVCLWWAGQNLLDVAPYIGDARALALPLVGEYSEEIADAREFRHDWHNILAEIDWLHLDARLAAMAHWLGVLVMLLALLWGLRWLWRGRREVATDA